MAAWGVEGKLRSFINMAIGKLDGAKESLADGTPEEDFEELVTFTSGFANRLRQVGSSASTELKGALKDALAPVWDLHAMEAGADLSVEALDAALKGLLAGPLAEPESIFQEPPAPEDGSNPENLKDMSMQEACTYMWNVLDKPNRIEWGDGGFTLDLQRKGNYDGRDTCADPLFSSMNKDHSFWGSRVTKAFVALLDNYEREVGVAERVTAEEKKEMQEFLHAVCESPIGKFTYHFLKKHGKDRRCRSIVGIQDFSAVLFDLWFAPYKRMRPNDSSGFEHVFVGEESRGKITGLHNWVQYFIEEQKGNIDYLGWKGRQDGDYNDDVNIVTVSFRWDDDDPNVETKPMSTILCGSTIEFEMCLLTMVFMCGEQEGETHFKLGSENIKVVCHQEPRPNYNASKIGTAYMEIA